MPKKPKGSIRSDSPARDPEEQRILDELHFKLWEESPDPGPLILTRPLRDDVGAQFNGHVRIDNETWTVRGVLRPDPVTGLLRMESLTLEPHGEVREVTGRVLRGIPVATIRDEAAHDLRFTGDQPLINLPGTPDRLLRLFPDAEQPVREKLVAAAQPKSRRGRPALADEQLREAAVAYLKLFESGVTRGLLQGVADHLGVARQTAADRVARARREGFLTPAQKGRAGARAGQRLSEAYPQPEQ